MINAVSQKEHITYFESWEQNPFHILYWGSNQEPSTSQLSPRQIADPERLQFNLVLSYSVEIAWKLTSPNQCLSSRKCAHTAGYVWHYLTTSENNTTNHSGAWHSGLWVRWLLHSCGSSWDLELCFSCTVPAAFIWASSCSGGRRNTRTTVMLSVEPDALAWHTKCWATFDPSASPNSFDGQFSVESESLGCWSASRTRFGTSEGLTESKKPSHARRM